MPHTDSNGTLTLDVGGTSFHGTPTCTVTATYGAIGESDGADVSVVLGGVLYRYIRLYSFTRGSNPMLCRFAIYNDFNGSDSNNSSQISGSSVDGASWLGYNSGYSYLKADNTATNQGWWFLGRSTSLMATDYIRIDQNTDSPIAIRSVLIGWNVNSGYWSPTTTIQGSNDGTNWTTLKAITGMTTYSQNSVNL